MLKFEEIYSNKVKKLDEYDAQADVFSFMATVSDGKGLLEQKKDS